MSERPYRSVLVVGGRKVGKTSILAASLNGDFSETYSPTGFRAESFYDVERGLQLIDTPGIDADSLITSNQYDKFKKDPIVYELLGKQSQDRRELLGNVDFTSLYGYVVVYSPSLPHTIKTARALVHVIRTEVPDKPVFVVENSGDIPPSVEDTDANTLWEKREKLLRNTIGGNISNNDWTQEDTYNLIYDEISPKKIGDKFNSVPHVHVCAQTFKGLDTLMNSLMSEDHKDALRQQFKRTSGGRSCDPRRCVIS